MPNENNETTSSSPQSTMGMSSDIKKMLIPIAITIILNFIVSYFAAQRSQDAVTFQTNANKEAITANSINIKQLADAQNQIVISMARFSEAQSRIADDLKQLQIDQRNFQMNKQK